MTSDIQLEAAYAEQQKQRKAARAAERKHFNAARRKERAAARKARYAAERQADLEAEYAWQQLPPLPGGRKRPRTWCTPAERAAQHKAERLAERRRHEAKRKAAQDQRKTAL